MRRSFEGLRSGAIHVPSRLIPGREFLRWIQAKISDLMAISESLKLWIAEIPKAMGEVGHAGDPELIRNVALELDRLGEQLIDWERDLRSGSPPDRAKLLKRTLNGMTDVVIRELEKLPAKLTQPFANGARPTSIDIMLTIDSPSLDPFMEEMRKLEAGPLDWLGD